jgi:imidazolonepropionase-like amidohydrolase
MIRALLVSTCLTLAAVGAAMAQTVAITGGKVVTNTSQGILENATVVIDGGKIVSVSTAAPPAGATIVDAKGKWVTPGLFAAFSQIGLAELDSEGSANDVEADASKFQASLHAADSFNPDDTAIAVSRIEDVTRVALSGAPGPSCSLRL